MSLMVAERNEELDVPAEMLIDFAEGTWTCSIHGKAMKLDSGQDCPACAVETRPPMPIALRLAAEVMLSG